MRRIIQFTLTISIVLFSRMPSLCQDISEKEYEIINDIGISANKGYLSPIYKVIDFCEENYSFLFENPTNNKFIPSGLTELEYLQFIQGFDFDSIRSDSVLESESRILKKKKLGKKIKITNSPKKGTIICRPIIWGRKAILYLKTSGDSFIETVFLLEKSTNWHVVGELVISIKIREET